MVSMSHNAETVAHNGAFAAVASFEPFSLCERPLAFAPTFACIRHDEARA
jgi:hypothetical protein